MDTELEAIKVYRMSDKGYIRVSELAKEAGDTIITPLLPGLKLSLSEVFENA